MRIKSTPNPLFRLFAFAATVFGSSLGFGQTTDLRIDFSGPQPQFVQVGSFFSIQGTISFDANGTTPVPAGAYGYYKSGRNRLKIKGSTNFSKKKNILLETIQNGLKREKRKKKFRKNFVLEIFGI